MRMNKIGRYVKILYITALKYEYIREERRTFDLNSWAKTLIKYMENK